LNFRQDINGLRAFAVLAVVVFHFSSNWLPGGFAGVDVFFVISGFLMTGLIFTKIESQTFSVLNFYKARANRIIPPLAFLCLALFIFAYFCFTPDNFEKLSINIAGSLSFISNVLFWQESSNYFSSSSHEKWLLHTWSLSVEWQFYLIYPLVLVFLKRFLSLDAIKKLIVIITLLGFLFCVIATIIYPTAAFYLLPTRIWEMTMGGIAFLYPWNLNEKNKVRVEMIGFGLIFFTYVFISSDDLWPGYLALLPVLGTYLIIQSARDKSILTANKFSQTIGKWSYSIYLWHWPVVVFMYMAGFESLIFIISGIIISTVLGGLSYNFIESTPRLRGSFQSSRLISFKPLLMVCLLIGCSTIAYFSKGRNINAELTVLADKLAFPEVCHVNKNQAKFSDEYINCKLGNEVLPARGLLWGDSYAGHLDPFVNELLDGRGAFISRTAGSCVPSLNANDMLGFVPAHCKKIRQTTVADIKGQKFDVIFIAGKWQELYKEHGQEGLVEVINAIELAAKNAHSVFFFEAPFYYKKRVSDIYLRGEAFSMFKLNLEKDDQAAQSANLMMKRLLDKREHNNVFYVNRTHLFTQNGILSDFSDDGLPYTYDNGHLNVNGSIKAALNFKKTELYPEFLNSFGLAYTSNVGIK
jgi:peptidoglycan/LPS O-acetylase OafA/YrhL